MFDYEKIVNSLVSEMNCDLPFSEKKEYKLLENSGCLHFVLLERKDKYGFDYRIYKLEINSSFAFPNISLGDSEFGFYMIRSFDSKEKAYSAYKALTASSYC